MIMHYLYLWKHKFVDPDTDLIIERTCFGITGNPARRINSYEGHTGHKVRFNALWKGPARLIKELESKIKENSEEFRVVGLNGFKYEWINEEVPYDQIYNWINLTLIKEVDGVEEVDSVNFL